MSTFRLHYTAVRAVMQVSGGVWPPCLVCTHAAARTREDSQSHGRHGVPAAFSSRGKTRLPTWSNWPYTWFPLNISLYSLLIFVAFICFWLLKHIRHSNVQLNINVFIGNDNSRESLQLTGPSVNVRRWCWRNWFLLRICGCARRAAQHQADGSGDRGSCQWSERGVLGTQAVSLFHCV